MLRLCSGEQGPGGDWIEGWPELEVRALHEGDEIAPFEPVMTIAGDYALFAHLETVYLGCLARRTLIMRNVREVVDAAARQADLLLPRAPRPLAGADRRRLGRACRRRDRRLHRRPGLVVGRARHRHRAPRADRRLWRRHRRGGAALRRALRRRDERHRAGGLRERLGSDRGGGGRRARRRALGRAPGHLRASGRPLAARGDGRLPADRASTSGWSRRCARRSTRAGHAGVRIVASGGFDAERIRAFEDRGRRRSTPTGLVLR